MRIRIYRLVIYLILSSTIAAQSITITSPKKGESWIQGEIYDISWKADNINGKIVIEYKDGYDSKWLEFNEVTLGEGSVSFYVQKYEYDYLYIRITSLESPSLSDETRIKITDCAGTPNGTAKEDNCGNCIEGVTDDGASSECVQDCTGIWGGNLKEDDCGVCGGDGSSCKGYLNITYTPTDATLFIDGIYYGKKSGISELLTSGRHTIKIKKYGYKEFNEILTIFANRTVERNVNLESTSYKKETKKDDTNLYIVYSPIDADLYIDNRIYRKTGTGASKNSARYTGTHSVGSHKISIKRKGYKTKEEWIKIYHFKTTFESIYLEPIQKSSNNKSTYSSKYSATSGLHQEVTWFIEGYDGVMSKPGYYAMGDYYVYGNRSYGFAYAPIEIPFNRPFGIYPFHNHNNYIIFSFTEKKEKWEDDSWNVVDNYFSAQYKKVTSNDKYKFTGLIELKDGIMNINTFGVGKYFNNSLLHMTLYDGGTDDIKHNILYEYYFNDYNMFSLEYRKMESGDERYDWLYKFLYLPSSYSASNSWLMSFYYYKKPVNPPGRYYTNFDIDIDYFFNNRFSLGTGYHYEDILYDDVITEYWEHFSYNASFVSKEFQNGNRFKITYDFEPWRDDWEIYNLNLYYLVD